MYQKKISLFLSVIALFSLIQSCSVMQSSSKESVGDSEVEIKDGKVVKQESATGLDDLTLKLNVKKIVLDNGLRILIHENHKLPIFSFYTFFDVGGRYEYKGITGASHFLEHLMFKGAKKYGPGKFDTIIEKNGGMTNAYTTFDSTVYYENLPSEMIENIIDLEADRMDNLLLEKNAFEKERLVVLEERKMRYENNPQGKIFLSMMQSMFRGTPYGLSVIGSAEDVKALNRDTVFKYFKKFYAPNNAVVVISGDVDSDKTIEYIKKYYGNIKKSELVGSTKKKMDSPKNFITKTKFRREVKLNGTNPIPMFILGYKGDKLGTRKALVLDILSMIMSGGSSSYLNQKYVQSKKPYLSSIHASNYNLRNDGVFFLFGSLMKKTNLRSFKRRVLRDIKNVCTEAVTERSVRKVKNQFLVSYYNEIKTNSGIASFLGTNENFFGDFNHYKKELKQYASIGTEEIKRECRNLFKDDKYVFLSIWNKHSKKRK